MTTPVTTPAPAPDECRNCGHEGRRPAVIDAGATGYCSQACETAYDAVFGAGSDAGAHRSVSDLAHYHGLTGRHLSFGRRSMAEGLRAAAADLCGDSAVERVAQAQALAAAGALERLTATFDAADAAAEHADAAAAAAAEALRIRL